MKYVNLTDAPMINRMAVTRAEPGASLVQIFYRRPPARVPHSEKSKFDLRLLDLSMGFDFDGVENYLTANIEQALSESYIEVGKFYAVKPVLEDLFLMMQGEMWSPSGEARELIRNKGLRHTSMSVGDIICLDGVAYYVDGFGFEEIKRA